ncbi:UBP1-associated protein 2B-like [Canna indica]|uniref:UBP1-associated protein 2B-like n=1 Tax=Canna indica TaxID=4628 RepID=A0AAQ3K4J0_9LILI|nr:UBP1-associated protein 2B-like [Canna indica]
MAKKRKLTSPAAAKGPAAEPKEETVEGEPARDAPIEEAQEEQPPSGADPDQQIHENSQPEVPSDGLGSSAADTDNGVEGGEASKGDDDDDEEEKDPCSIQKLLEPFPKDHLVELLRDAAVKHPDVMTEIHRVADLDPAHRKIFVHGLGWDTNAQVLTAAFRQYGEIEDCNAVMDKATGKSKGYGFILFKHRAGARRALKEPQKKIGNRMTACQLASAGPVPPPAPPVSEYTQRKIFVSNVGAELDPQKLLQFFSKFGEIEEGPLGLDKVTGKPKGFALFVYKTIDSARKALEEPHKNYEGHILHCQKAIDGPKPNKPGYQFHGSGAHHGMHQGVGGMIGSHFSRNETTGLLGGVGSHLSSASGAGHLMAPSATGLGFNQAAQPAAAVAAAAGLNPALGQALTAFLATQGAGLGLTNVLGGLGSSGIPGAVMNQGASGTLANSSGHGLHSGYGGGGNMNSGMIGGYGSQAHMQGGYGNSSAGQGGAGRSQPGHGQMGGLGPYISR